MVRVQVELQSDPMNCVLQQRESPACEVLLVKGKSYHALMVQHTKAKWLNDGDDNTTYFHGMLKK